MDFGADFGVDFGADFGAYFGVDFGVDVFFADRVLPMGEKSSSMLTSP